MAKHPDLLALKKNLKHFYCYFKSDTMLSISEDKSMLPFICVIHDDKYPNNLLLSIALDYPNAEKAVEIALYASKIKSTALTEPFFFSGNGSTYVGDEAHDQFQLEVMVPLEDLQPPTDSLH